MSDEAESDIRFAEMEERGFEGMVDNFTPVEINPNLGFVVPKGVKLWDGVSIL